MPVDLDDPNDLVRTLRAWATTNRDYADALRRTDPSWGSDAFEFAGGIAALHGPGLYVNAACAVGIDAALTAPQLADFERRCGDVGVRPAIETTPLTHPDTTELLAAHGYVADDEVVAFRRTLDDRTPGASVPDWMDIEPIGDDPDRVRIWQEAAAEGWGHVEPARRRASDAFGAVAAIVDDPGLLVAVDRTAGTAGTAGAVVGCASLSIVDGIATLGGMSTVPAARRRGVQAALIEHRLDLAGRLGADLAVSTTVPDGASRRNLERHGFAPWCRVVTHVRTV